MILNQNSSIRIAGCGAGEGSEVFATAEHELKKYIAAVCAGASAAEKAGNEMILATDDSLTGDGFRIYAKDGSLHLCGGNGRGVLYAVYGLLRFVGCRFYAQDTEIVPKLGEILLPDDLDIAENSPFEYRDVYWTTFDSPEFCAKLHVNGSSVGQPLPKEVGGGCGFMPSFFVHTFERLLPSDRYFDEHPEYYSEIDGKRTGKYLYSQPCLSNPEVRRIMTDALLDNIRASRAGGEDAKIVSLSQNDSFLGDSSCQCEACRKVNEEEGSPSGMLLRFVNEAAREIAKEFPDMIVDTLAYQYTTCPPRLTRPEKNVVVRMCTGYCSAHALEACEKNRPPRECIENWEKVCDRLYIWDYTADFAQYLNHVPNLSILAPNVRYFREHHVRGVFEQGNYNGGKSGEFGELRGYLLAELLWNPDFDVRTGIDDFLTAYYGGAAPYIREYLEFMEKKYVAQEHSFVEAASSVWKDAVSDEELSYLDELWNCAYKAALSGADQPGGIPAALCYEHTERSALCHRWIKLDTRRGEFADSAAFDALCSAFYGDCARLGVKRLSEGADVPPLRG